MSNKLVGYTCLTEMVYGQDLVWQTQQTPESPIIPDIYPDEVTCRKEMVDEVIQHLDEFIAGDREYDNIVWPENEYQVVSIEVDIDEDMITCWDEQGNVVWERSLSLWREQL